MSLSRGPGTMTYADLRPRRRMEKRAKLGAGRAGLGLSARFHSGDSWQHPTCLPNTGTVGTSTQPRHGARWFSGESPVQMESNPQR